MNGALDPGEADVDCGGECVGCDDGTSCTVDSDCTIRVPDCCECGADTSVSNLIALASSSVSAYTAAICDPAQACDGCVPTYPGEAEAVCVSGACRVRVGDP